MVEAKATASSMASNPNLKLNDGSSSVYETEFGQVVGSLQYLSLTKPGITFSVNKIAQFMHAPTKNHWTSLKRLQRYLKGTLLHGLFLHRNSSLNLKAFSDSNWAGDLDESNSTTNYILYLRKNPVSWMSVKQKTISRSSIKAE